jgi:hypothetical protein
MSWTNTGEFCYSNENKNTEIPTTCPNVILQHTTGEPFTWLSFWKNNKTMEK